MKQRFYHQRAMGPMALLLAAAFALTACSSGGPAVSGTTSADSSNSSAPQVDLSIKEAPSLATLVEKGELAALSERLPENPKVVKPYESYGVYGGTWRQTVTNATKGHAFKMIGYYQGMNLVTWNKDCTEIEPNLASSAVLSEDCKTLTVTLRKGLKWSDGQPMTTEDVQFWWDAYANNKTISPGSTTWNSTTLTVKDDITFVMTFEEPRPFMLTYMADGSTGSYWFLPKHYLEQFHADYSDQAEKTAKSLSFDSWVNCFLDRMDYMTNQDMPVMSPWMLTTSGTAATQLTFARNPYYWATDDAGRQLPYIDSCVINLAQSDDIVTMKNVSGEFEIAFACVMEDMANYPLYAENAEQAGYTVCTSEFDEPNAMNIHLNITSADEVKRSYYQQTDFRRALSLAINRQEIIDVQFTVGKFKSVARQFSPVENSPYYDESLSTQYTQYDVDGANALLDGLGLTSKNGDGFRLMRNGKVLSIVIEVPAYSNQWLDVANMIASYWQKIGINASTKSVDTSLWETHCASNSFDCTVFTGGGGFEALSDLTVNDYTGYDYFAWPQRFAAGAYTWRSTKGQGGVEPPQYIKDLWDLGEKLVQEPDKQQQQQDVEQILKIHRDNLLVLGVCSRLPALYLVKNNVHNVPTLSPSWAYGYTGHGSPDQYYIS